MTLPTYDFASLFKGENAIDLSGLYQPIFDLLPVIIPIAVTFIGVHKGISFLFGSLRSC